jgi:hypothetical protein
VENKDNSLSEEQTYQNTIFIINFKKNLKSLQIAHHLKKGKNVACFFLHRWEEQNSYSTLFTKRSFSSIKSLKKYLKSKY